MNRPDDAYLATLTENTRQYIADLEAAVAKFPKTADNVPVVPEFDTAWIVKKNGEIVECGIWWDRAFDDFCCGGKPMSKCYSTREAAEASGEKHDG